MEELRVWQLFRLQFLRAASFSTAAGLSWIERGTLAPVHSPYNGEVVSQVIVATRAQAEEAIGGAVAAFAATRKMPAFDRQKVLERVSAGIASRGEDFARTMAHRGGQAHPHRPRRGVPRRFTFKVAAEESGRIYGEYLPLDGAEIAKNRWGIVRRFPLGPIAAITPFNFPLNLVAHKIAPAIAAGCTMVLKPAPQAPSCALMLARLVEEAGWPAGALSVLPLSNDDAAPLVEDTRLKMLTFPGSTAVGWALKSRTGKKRVTLELGGNAAVVVHSDADLEYAADRCVTLGYA